MKKDIKLLLFMITLSVISVANLIIKENLEWLFYIIAICALSIIQIYYAYGLNCLGNRWTNFWREKNPGDGRPTKIYLIMTKISGWMIFIATMMISIMA